MQERGNDFGHNMAVVKDHVEIPEFMVAVPRLACLVPIVWSRPLNFPEFPRLKGSSDSSYSHNHLISPTKSLDNIYLITNFNDPG